MSCKGCVFSGYSEAVYRDICSYAYIMNETRTHKISSLVADGKVTERVREELKKKPCILYRKGKRRVKPLP